MTWIVARIGSDAGLAADYWRDGVYVYEATTGSRALIEQKSTGLWQGQIIVQTQRGQAAQLLERLVTLVEDQQSRTGLTPSRKTAPPPRAISETETMAIVQKRETPPLLKFTQEPSLQPELFVSYAWGDGTPEGKRREEVVDKLCAAAEKRGLTILRDKKTLGLGDRISKFMDRIGAGGRIFAVLSDKYLKSPYCMYELMEVWRNCRQEEESFLERIRIIVLPDAKISRAVDRVRYANYWHDQLKELEKEMKPYERILLGERDFNEYRMMQEFSGKVGDILATVADVVRAQTDEEFEKYALDDLIKPAMKTV
jgi:internalin A